MSTGHGPPDPTKSRIAATMGKARILMEAMPYMKAFRGTTLVVKYGGSAMVDESLRSSFADDIALLHLVGIRPVIVHGGGPQISEAMQRAGIEPRWVDGLRVTDAETLQVVQSTLAGRVNPDIVRLINGHGALAAGVSGLDGRLLVARPRDPRLGFVGVITEVNAGIIRGLQREGFVPVVAPLARGEDGSAYNINADTAAGALAVALEAEKLVYLTDVEGLYADPDDSSTVMQRIGTSAVKDLLASGAVRGGMLPKLTSCVDALDAGVRRAHILDGRVQHSLLLEIFTPEGIGTMIGDEVPGG